MDAKLDELLELDIIEKVLISDDRNPSEEKIATIKDASEVLLFMGLVQYSAKIMPDVASVAKLIQKLTRKGVIFQWSKEQQTAFLVAKASNHLGGDTGLL